jgi:hypothetical protein
MFPKCPKCEKALTSAKVGDIDLAAPRVKMAGLVFTCPYCSSVLGVQVNPLILRDETANQVIEALRKK